MKKIKIYALAVLAAAALSQAAHARRGEMLHEDVFIPKGQTSGDVFTDKSITVEGVLNGDAVSVGGASVTVSGEVTGDLISMGGPVYVGGQVKGDLVSMGGPVEVSGLVEGDISGIGATVKLSGTGRVEGDISALGGTLVKGEKAVHTGETRNFDVRAARKALPRVLRMMRSGERHSEEAGPLLIGGLIGLGILVMLSALLTGAILLILPAVFFPKNTEAAAAAITGDMWKACGVGALMVMGFFPGLMLMVVSVMGIPLVPFAMIVYAAAAVLGFTAFSVVLQGRFFEGIKKNGPAGLPGKAVAGYALTAGLIFFGKIIPFVGGVLTLIGLMLLCFGVMAGLGAVWLTRMGTRPMPLSAAAPAVQPQVPQLPPQAQ